MTSLMTPLAFYDCPAARVGPWVASLLTQTDLGMVEARGTNQQIAMQFQLVLNAITSSILEKR